MSIATNTKPAILVVEDSKTQAERLRADLEGAFPDFLISVAGNGREALAQLQDIAPALIISDVVMPEMNGYEMCRAIKDDPVLRRVPVVLLTSLSASEDVIKGLNAGTDYYLTKPYERGFLVNKVEAILGDHTGPESVGDAGWRVRFAGQSHLVRADLQQMLNLLLSTYENAVQQNRQLLATQDELRKTNERLEERVRERTIELSTANEQLRIEVEERGRAQRQLQIQLERLDALRQIDMAIAGSLDIRVALNVVLDQVVTQLGVDAASIWLMRPHSMNLEFSAGRGFSSRLPGSGASVPSGSPALRAARDRVIERIEDLRFAESLPRSLDDINTEGFVGYMAIPLIAKGRSEGVLELFHRETLEETPEWLDFLEALAGQAAIAIDSALMFEDVQRSNAELLAAYDTTLEGWSRALDLRDKETEGHSMRVTEMTERIARQMDVPDLDLLHMRRGALLHDIGKLAVPDSILRKPGPLEPEERAIMEKHPVHAFEMLAPIGFLRPALDIPYGHHERWDGGGYPRGLREEQIPLAARIFAVADVWDALRSDRPYRAGWPRQKVLAHITKGRGSHFDPVVVDAFVVLVESLGEAIDDLPDHEAEESSLSKGGSL